MSDPATLPAPRRRPGVRRLNWLPGIIGGVSLVTIVLVAIYTMARLSSGSGGEETKTSIQFPSSADEVIARAPAESAIPFTQQPVVLTPQSLPEQPRQAVETPQTKREPVDPDMTEVAIEARRRAWQAHYQTLADKKDEERKALKAALSGNASIGETASANGASTGAASSSASPAAPGGLNGDQPQSVAQHQRDFLGGNGSSPDTDYSPYTVTTPISKYELKAGDIITGRMISGLNSDGPGIIKAIVSSNVYDHATGMKILIPQGSTLVGVYDNAVAYGQNRVVVGWQRVIYPPPGDESLDIGRMPGSDQSGFAGMQDMTDNHYGQIFTNAILLSLFSAGTQLAQPQSKGDYYSPGQTVASSMGQQLGQLGQEFARRGLDIPPTNMIRNGYPFTIMITKDIAFLRPWNPATAAGQSKMGLVNAE